MEYIKYKKRGITLIEVISFLFIIIIIFTITLPFILKIKGSNLDKTTNKFVLELRKVKSMSIARDRNVYVKFYDFENGGYTLLGYYIGVEKQGEYKLPKGYIVNTNNEDLYNGSIAFKPDGTLNHRATTIKVKDIKTEEINKVTLTIGYTRIMKVD